MLFYSQFNHTIILEYRLNHFKYLPPETATARQLTATTTAKLARGYYYHQLSFSQSLNPFKPTFNQLDQSKKAEFTN